MDERTNNDLQSLFFCTFHRTDTEHSFLTLQSSPPFLLLFLLLLLLLLHPHITHTHTPLPLNAAFGIPDGGRVCLATGIGTTEPFAEDALDPLA